MKVEASKFNYEGIETIIKIDGGNIYLYLDKDFIGPIYIEGNNIIKIPWVDSLFKASDSFWDKIYDEVYYYYNGYGTINDCINSLNLSKKEIEIITKEFKRHKEINEYADNFRIAEVGNKEQEKKYKQAHSHGCCGFIDTIIEVGDKRYKIGFNYGH